MKNAPDYAILFVFELPSISNFNYNLISNF